MPERDDVDKLLAEEQALEKRKQEAVAALLKEKDETIKDHDRRKAEAVKAIDDQLGKLGYSPDGAKAPKRTHHAKRPAVKPSAIKTKDKDKTS